MAELTKLYLDAVSKAEEERWLAEMDEAARCRVEKTLHPLRRRQRIAGDHLAREALARITQQPLQAVEIRRHPSGKPFAEGGFFSVSHCDALVICVAGREPVGADAERIRPYDVRIPKRFFTAAEQALLKEASDGESCFWRIWTGKEALVKLSGEGLAGLRAADICALPDGVRLSWKSLGEHIAAIAEQTE